MQASANQDLQLNRLLSNWQQWYTTTSPVNLKTIYQSTINSINLDLIFPSSFNGLNILVTWSKKSVTSIWICTMKSRIRTVTRLLCRCAYSWLICNRKVSLTNRQIQWCVNSPGLASLVSPNWNTTLLVRRSTLVLLMLVTVVFIWLLKRVSWL